MWDQKRSQNRRRNDEVFNEPSEITSKDSGFNQLNSSDIKRKREKKCHHLKVKKENPTSASCQIC